MDGSVWCHWSLVVRTETSVSSSTHRSLHGMYVVVCFVPPYLCLSTYMCDEMLAIYERMLAFYSMTSSLLYLYLLTSATLIPQGRTGDMSTHAVNQLASWMLEHPSIDDVTTVSRPGAEPPASTATAAASAAATATATATGTAVGGASAGRGAEVRLWFWDAWWMNLPSVLLFLF